MNNFALLIARISTPGQTYGARELQSVFQEWAQLNNIDSGETANVVNRVFPYVGSRVRLRQVRTPSAHSTAMSRDTRYHASELAFCARKVVWATNVFAVNRRWRAERPRFAAPLVWRWSERSNDHVDTNGGGDDDVTAAAATTMYCILEPSRMNFAVGHYRDSDDFFQPKPHYRLHIACEEKDIRRVGVGGGGDDDDNDNLDDPTAFLRRARRMLGPRIDVVTAPDFTLYPSRNLRLPPVNIYAHVYYILSFDAVKDDESEALTRALILTCGPAYGSDVAAEPEKLASARPWLRLSVHRDFPHDTYIPHSLRTLEDEADMTIYAIGASAYASRARAMCRLAARTCVENAVRVLPLQTLNHVEFHRYGSRHKGPALTVECTHDYSTAEIVPRASVALRDVAERNLRLRDSPQLCLVHDDLISIRRGGQMHLAFMTKFRCCRQCNASDTTARCERCATEDIRVVRTFAASSATLLQRFKTISSLQWEELTRPPSCCVPVTMCTQHQQDGSDGDGGGGGGTVALEFSLQILHDMPSLRWTRMCDSIRVSPRLDYVVDATHRALMRNFDHVTLAFDRSATIYYARKV